MSILFTGVILNDFELDAVQFNTFKTRVLTMIICKSKSISKYYNIFSWESASANSICLKLI